MSFKQKLEKIKEKIRDVQEKSAKKKIEREEQYDKKLERDAKIAQIELVKLKKREGFKSKIEATKKYREKTQPKSSGFGGFDGGGDLLGGLGGFGGGSGSSSGDMFSGALFSSGGSRTTSKTTSKKRKTKTRRKKSSSTKKSSGKKKGRSIRIVLD